MTSLKLEILQEPPFASVQEEALLNLMRTSDAMSRALQQGTREWGLTATQYNVLRILRGAGERGLTCAGIGERMIAADPDITRLLTRLKARKLIRQARRAEDRRVVWTSIAPAGRALLEQMDEAILALPRQLLGHLSEAELRQLIRLLEAAREKSSF